MATKKLEIANAQGFWGDQCDAAYTLACQQPSLDYITMDYLSEVSMSIMAIQKEKDPSSGYAKDFVDVVRSLIPIWEKGGKVKLVTNAGGLNPQGCAEACLQVLKKSGVHKKIGVVYGDDVLDLIKQNGFQYKNLDTGEGLAKVMDSLVTANAYLGGKSIAEAIEKGADIVITGRVADPSLTVGPCVAHFGWKWDEYDRIAGATIAGHLIECGTQVTGGISTNWLSIVNPARLGFPFVEMEESGEFVITKPQGTTGIVNEGTVKEQLLYEIGDPDNYLSPDATVSFLSLRLDEQGNDRIRVMGAKGKAPPSTYKVSATYRDGYKSEAMLVVIGRHAVIKGERCGKMILARLKDAGYEMARSQVECFGESDSLECVMRIAVADPREEAVSRFAKEIAPLVTSGPQGTTGYMSGRPSVRPVFGYWPCLIDVNKVHPKVSIYDSL